MHAVELKTENLALVELLLNAGAVVNQETQVLVFYYALQ